MSTKILSAFFAWCQVGYASDETLFLPLDRLCISIKGKDRLGFRGGGGGFHRWMSQSEKSLSWQAPKTLFYVSDKRFF
jgi:hypothetical protein